jgi:uncharacterized protein
MERRYSMKKVLSGRAIVHGKVEGRAIVSTSPVSFFLCINTDTGVFIEKGHELEGISFAGCVLVYPNGKGSSGDCLRLWRASNNGVAPIAIVNRVPDFVHVQGAIIANIPMVCNFEVDPLENIITGDYLSINGPDVYVH